ncbi:MAG: succinate dehydrogenase cytochrome b subunit [Acidimicrobiales bacterium]|jgi:succinate dehydrogenase / fumarate reductase cytochrome b subunit|nr:succinate dehydrogenase cytochrome b subunit [Acidimicrobiales bacterium]
MAQATSPSRHDVAPTRKRPPQLPWPLNIYQTAIGKKYVMAITGIGLLGYVVVHMIGNLHLYEGPYQVHAYAEALRDLGGHLAPRTFILWVLRLGLFGMFVMHILSAWSLSRMSHKADNAYAGGRTYTAASFASRTMRWTGPITLLYVLFHLADLTWGWVDDDWVRGDPYHNVYSSMSAVPIALIYIAANVALAIHIFHGAWSMFQSLGINNPRYNSLRRGIAQGLAGLILVGNLSFPLAVQFGLIDEDNRGTPIGFTHEGDAAGDDSHSGEAGDDAEGGE